MREALSMKHGGALTANGRAAHATAAGYMTKTNGLANTSKLFATVNAGTATKAMN